MAKQIAISVESDNGIYAIRPDAQATPLTILLGGSNEYGETVARVTRISPLIGWGRWQHIIEVEVRTAYGDDYREYFVDDAGRPWPAQIAELTNA